MGEAVELRPPVPGCAGDRSRTRALVAISGMALAAQVVLTDYGTDGGGTAGFWFLVGCALLWLVYRRRSRAARGVLIVTSLAGAVVYGVGALGDARSSFLALTYLAQAAPLMTQQVRLHVGAAA